jgi:hypothetical protein
MSVTTILKPKHCWSVFPRFRLMLLNAREHYERKGLFFVFKLLLAKAGFVHFSRSLKIVKMDLSHLRPVKVNRLFFA